MVTAVAAVAVAGAAAWISQGGLDQDVYLPSIPARTCLTEAELRLSSLHGEHVAPGEPTGWFADAEDDAILGWRWVRWGNTWRQSLMVQPPCRLTADIRRPADGPVRLYATLPRARLGEIRKPVVITCGAADDGDTPHTLDLSPTGRDNGRWEEITLDPAGDTDGRITVTIDAGPAEGAADGGALSVLALATTGAAPAQTGPNCLFILVDALRADHLGCYGFDRPITPGIDRLAADGVLFERVVSSCSWTVPSVASLYTGTYVSTHGVTGEDLPAEIHLPTLAGHFLAAGCRTMGVAANPAIKPECGYGAGFETFVTFEEGPEKRQFARAERLNEPAIKFLRQVGGQRFFLYVHYMDPHDRYDPPADFARFGTAEPHDRYLGEILYADDQIARLLREVDALGLRQNTLVVFIADHGEAFMEHGFRVHGNTLHAEEVNVPLILRLPGRLPAGRRVTAQVRSIDAHATVLDLMGFATPRHLEGESLVSLAVDPAADAPPPADRVAISERRECFAGKTPLYSISDGRYKLILNGLAGKQMLYDVRTDPGEARNLAVGLPDVTRSMARRLAQFARERRAPAGDVEVNMSEETKRRLRALGYLDPGE